MSRGMVWRAGAALAAIAVLLCGALGAYGYGQDYNLHRGFASVVQLPRAGTGRLLDVHFRSAALHRRADYMVYLPPGYTPAKRYPVYYLLHGMPGQPHVFVTIANLDVRLDNLLSTGRARPMILVFPDGRIGGSVYSDSEWANTPSGDFESYVLNVMHNVDARFSTLPDRADRVIGGFSAGAYGAINIALHNLSAFASVQLWSGYFTETRNGVFAHAGRATLAYNSPYDYVTRAAQTIRRDGLRVSMFVGRDDESSAQLLPMAARLRAAGVGVTAAIYPGGHDWSVWYPRLNAMLILASRDMGVPPSPPPTAGRAVAIAVRHRTPGGRQATPGPSRVPAVLRPRPVRTVTGAVVRRARRGHGLRRAALIAALLLALVSGALINIGFVLQQRGLRGTPDGGGPGLLAAAHSRTWLAGQLVGWAGFAGQIVAVAAAPLALVQAFAAGSLALSIPVAARLFGLRVHREQLVAIGLVAAALFLLPIGFASRHAHLHPGVLIAAALAGGAVAAAVARVSAGAARAVAAGLCYGIADAAIKAAAVAVHAHGVAGLWSGWVLLAMVATFGGFIAFQSALRRADAVTAVSLMNALTAVTAVSLGLLAFGESLGRSPALGALHVAAIAVVLGCVAPLARGQVAPARSAGATGAAPARGLRRPRVTRPVVRRAGLTAAAAALAVVLTLAASVGSIGLLYELRRLGWFAAGPSVPDALPLLQLAGVAGQPLARVLAAGLLTGAALGVLLIRVRPGARAAIVALTSVFVLLLASDASYALARNLRFWPIATGRAPGLGPWLEALLLSAGAVLPLIWPAVTAGALRTARALRSHWPARAAELGEPRPMGL
jgi:enterochelin esterase-like enzyme/drug/metabolite transporter (DMT)-like permease